MYSWLFNRQHCAITVNLVHLECDRESNILVQTATKAGCTLLQYVWFKHSTDAALLMVATVSGVSL